MAALERTPTEAGALAAKLLADACRPHTEGSLRLDVVRGLALDLGRRLEALDAEDGAADSLVEAGDLVPGSGHRLLDDYAFDPGSAKNRSATSRCTITHHRARDGTRSRLSTISGVATL